MKKICAKCKQSLNLQEFAFRNRVEEKRQPYCNECRSTLAKESYGRHRKNVIKATIARNKLVHQKYIDFKKTQKCRLCSENEPSCLTFHHLDPSTKDFEVASMRSQAWSRIKKEIDKCVCLCMNCHAKVHAKVINFAAV